MESIPRFLDKSCDECGHHNGLRNIPFTEMWDVMENHFYRAENIHFIHSREFYDIPNIEERSKKVDSRILHNMNNLIESAKYCKCDCHVLAID